jgi:DNA-binding CsgD family transcriptional regulator/tetratricopeptide (TPR) repeat protein
LTSPELIGRDEPLQAVLRAWNEAVAGQTNVVVISGEAGIGKTRILEEVVARVGSQALVLRGACVRLSGTPLPLAPFRAAFRDLLPGLGQAAPSDVDVRESVAGAVQRAAQDRTVLLAVEDLHWADQASLELIYFLVRAAPRSRLLLVLNHRPGIGLAAMNDLLIEVGRLPRVQTLELPRLHELEVARLMHGILGRAPEAAQARRVALRSDGIPFAVEMLTSAESQGVHHMTEGLRDALMYQASTVSPDARGVLEAAAVMGVAIDEPTIATLSGISGTHLRNALRELVDAYLLVVEHEHHGYAFRHALLREAVEAAILPGQATELHRACAEMLDARVDRSTADVIEAAHHWWLTDCPDRTYSACLAAAASARDAGAHADESLMLGRALDLWGSEKATDAIPDRVALMRLAAGAAFRDGSLEAAHRLFDAAWRAVGPDRNPERAAAVLVEETRLIDELGDLPGVEEALDTVLANLDPGPSRARGEALTGKFAFAQHHRASPHVRGALVAEATTCVDAAGDVEAGTLLRIIAAGLIGSQAGRQDEALAKFAAARRFAESHDDHPNVLMALINESDFLFALGRFQLARERAQQGLDLAEIHGAWTIWRDFLVGNLAVACTATGDWTPTERLLEDLLELDRPGLIRAGAFIDLGGLRVAQGDTVAAAAAAREAHARLDITRPDPQCLVALATLDATVAMARGLPTTALEHARTGAARAHEVWPALAWPLLHAALAAARTPAGTIPGWLGDAIEAQRCRVPRLPWWEAVIDADLQGLQVAAWDAAVEAVHSAQGPVLLRLEVLIESARAHLAHRDRPAAAGLLRQAVAVAEHHGAAAALVRARDLAERSHLAPSSTPPAQAGGLTPREQEIIQLVAAGRGNAAIAAELVISIKTVGVHVSHIMEKLRASSRGEAAAIARDRGLL